MKAVAIFAVIMIVSFPALALLGEARPTLVALGVVVVPATVFAVIASVGALVWKQSAGRAAQMAFGISLGVCLTLGVLGAILVKGASPSCDSYCFNQTQGRVLALVLATSFGLIIALPAAGGAALIVSTVRHWFPTRQSQA